MFKRFTLLAVTLAACSSDPAPLGRPDAAVEADTGSAAVDIAASYDAATADLDAPDVAADSGNEAPDADAGAGCEALSPAACMADARCTLNGGCVDVAGTDVPFQYLSTGTWVGTAESEGEKGFPSGATAATLSLFRSTDRDVRGVLSLPDHGATHNVWGGVGPSGEIGLYLAPAACADDAVCSVPFAPAYDAGGIATNVTLEISDVLFDPGVVDFRTFVSLRMSPSDGFKPVAPVQTRTDELVAAWTGDMVAVDPSGNVLEYFCSIQLDRPRGTYEFRAFNCAGESGATLAQPPITSGDATSIAYANGVGWFATGTADDDFVFVGRVGINDPWQGIIARRGDVWTPGEPVDPGDVPVEAIRGTFQFYGLPLP